jgi:hypothetical protein
MTRSSHSRASDTSSAYSGSDVMQSSTNGDDGLMINNGENNLGQNDDGGLSRCISVHESDDESETSSEVIIRNFNSNEFCFFYLAFISHS